MKLSVSLDFLGKESFKLTGEFETVEFQTMFTSFKKGLFGNVELYLDEKKTLMGIANTDYVTFEKMINNARVFYIKNADYDEVSFITEWYLRNFPELEVA